MSINKTAYLEIIENIKDKNVTLVAVSKTKPNQDISDLYDLGQRDFGENYVQELVDKQAALPKEIHWHFIGHLQSNKVKYIAPFVYLIHGVDGFKLLKEINKQAAKSNRVIDCLLQVHIGQEETKFGLDESELSEIFEKIDEFAHVRICGFMGMASFSEDLSKVRSEFKTLKLLFDHYRTVHSSITILSMGMSGDYQLAIEEGSTMVRIGSLLFGARNYSA